MRKNFSVLSSVEIASQGCSYDLHNDFKADEIRIDLSCNSMTLAWRSIVSVGCLVVLRFAELDFLEIESGDNNAPGSENRVLAFLGYLHPDDDSMDAFLPEEYSSKKHRMIFCFESGLAVKVHGKMAHFEELTNIVELASRSS